MTVARPKVEFDVAAARACEPRPAAALLSIGAAVPEMSCSQQEFAAIMTAALDLTGPALDRWRRIIAGSEIQTRHGVMRPEQVITATTAQRMQAYEQFAPRLAHQAAKRALDAAGLNPADVTDLVIVSCTGFSAPGVDVALVQSLGLRATVRRTVVGFMGCFGAIPGLRVAAGACAANAEANEPPIALVVCVELCSLHVRPDRDVQHLVASALFGDGAAAAVVTALPDGSVTGGLTSMMCLANPAIGWLTAGANLLLPHGCDWMTWRITDAGFAMTLAREVPVTLRDHLKDFVNGAELTATPRTWIVHPGGPGILDAVSDALDLQSGCGLQHSRTILHRFGNMSSATVLFVLEEALRLRSPLPARLLAFGPGLTIESLEILPVR